MKKSNFRSYKIEKIVKRKRYSIYPLFPHSGSSRHSYQKHKNEENNTIILFAPTVFSFIKNHNEMLQFFSKMNRLLRVRKNIFLDMQAIEDITEDAVLYLISRLVYRRNRYTEHGISGNFPKDKKCEEILFACRFNEYVSTDRKHSVGDQSILCLKDGFESDGQYIKTILDFISQNVKLDTSNKAGAYSVITEVLTNTKNHAYANPGSFSKWWMIALPDEKRNIVHITLLDNGQGIPKTLKKNFPEKFASILEKISFLKNVTIKNNDVKVIEAALNGEFRTRTGERFRGTGMPTIFDASSNPQIENLLIISNFAYIKIGNLKTIDSRITLKDMFEGTLISWDFIS